MLGYHTLLWIASNLAEISLNCSTPGCLYSSTIVESSCDMTYVRDEVSEVVAVNLFKVILENKWSCKFEETNREKVLVLKMFLGQSKFMLLANWSAHFAPLVVYSIGITAKNCHNLVTICLCKDRICIQIVVPDNIDDDSTIII